MCKKCISQKIYDYMNNGVVSVIITAIFVLAVYGIKLCVPSTSIDNEAVISIRDSIYNAWLGMGRIGLVGFKKAMGQYIYNPVFTMALLVFGMILSSAIWKVVFDSVAPKSDHSVSPWIFSTILFTAPIIAEQFGFVMQSVEVLIAIDLCGIGLYFFFSAFSKKKKYLYLLFNILLSALAFSVYQALTTIYITAAVGMFILYLSRKETIEKSNAEVCKILITLIVSFFIAYLIYLVSSKIILAHLGIDASNYTSDQILWKTNSIKECLIFILEYVKNVILGKSIFYSVSYLILVVLMTVMCILKRNDSLGNKYYLYVLAHIVLFISPFFMGIILGGTPTNRTVISMPFMLAFGYMYLYYRICDYVKSKKVLVLTMLLALIVPYSQATESSRLYYTEYITNKEQEIISTKISYKIEEVTGQRLLDKPVAFVGALQAQRNPSCYTSDELEIVGQGFYDISFSTSHGTYLNINFLKTLGINYIMPTYEQTLIAEDVAKDMPCWPHDGSVVEVDGIVVVKLS